MTEIDQQSKSQVFPPWHFERWRAVDDRVRGGSSVSHMDPVDSKHGSTLGGATSEKAGSSAARFWGHLGTYDDEEFRGRDYRADMTTDISTLGGAGFASQTFLFAPTPLHLSRTYFDGIRLGVSTDPQASESSPANFTLVLKNTIRTKPPKEPKLPPQPEPAVLTYEAPFHRPSKSFTQEAESVIGASGSKGAKVKEIEIEWSEFKPHYRGREIPRDDERWKPLDTEGIFEISFMCRSGFGKQEGDFGIIIDNLSGMEKRNTDLLGMGGGRGGGNWEQWFRSWWAWLSSFFVGGGKIRLDEKV